MLSIHFSIAETPAGLLSELNPSTIILEFWFKGQTELPTNHHRHHHLFWTQACRQQDGI